MGMPHGAIVSSRGLARGTVVHICLGFHAWYCEGTDIWSGVVMRLGRSTTWVCCGGPCCSTASTAPPHRTDGYATTTIFFFFFESHTI
jgi:hypothetical protein